MGSSHPGRLEVEFTCWRNKWSVYHPQISYTNPCPQEWYYARSWKAGDIVEVCSEGKWGKATVESTFYENNVETLRCQLKNGKTQNVPWDDGTRIRPCTSDE